MSVHSLRERGGRNIIIGDLSSRKIIDYVIRPKRAGGGCCPAWPIPRGGGGGGGGGGV